VRIALVSLDYPPESTEGVARQRQVLGEALVRLGHEVHVVTRGKRRESVVQDGVQVHRLPAASTPNTFVTDLPVLDRPLSDAQLLCEGVLDLARRACLDVVDVPLWLAQPMALVRHAPCPVVVWLQTTLLQLVELQGRPLRPHEQTLAAIDRYVLSHASASIADSASVLAEVERLYTLPSLRERTTIVHPGLPGDVKARESNRARSRTVEPDCLVERPIEALVVGRLEQRKGTRLLLDVLPELLAAVPNITIRFVGRDNSASDGFQRETGICYPDAFLSSHPALAARVRFEGYVDEATLAARYGSADLLLHPALYESFGLIFLEAMRAALPVVAFKTGGACEVFAGGEADGAVLCDPGASDSLVGAVAALARDAARRRELGLAGRRAFEAGFTDDRMARETAEMYARVVGRERLRSRPRVTRVFQVMEALQDRDAVSRIARTNAATLAQLGGERPILSLFAEASVRCETGRLRGVRFTPDDAAIFHYWGFSRLERLIGSFPGRKAIHYHNITPPHFFAPRSPHYEMTSRGYAQLDRIANRFDLVIGDSLYNLREYAARLTARRPMLCLYPAIDAAALRAAAWDEAYAARLERESDGPVWLFVGRFAPNKRQDQVMRAFDRFASGAGGGRLLLVGDTNAVPAYMARLEQLRQRLDHGSRIEFVGSVADEVLRACYRAADLFVCASEHEGFCVPLAEAMAFGVPAVALDRGAVGETLGAAGALVNDWQPERVAILAAGILESASTRQAIADAQAERLRAFSPAAVRDGLRAAVCFLRDGTPNPQFIFSGAPPIAGLSERCA